MRNHVSKILVMLAAALAVLCASAEGQAQRLGPRERGYTRAEVDAVIHRVEERSDEFIRMFDKSLDHSRLDGTRREDVLNADAKRLAKSLDELRREFDRRENYRDTRPEVGRSLDIAGDINRTMRRRRLGAGTEEQWSLLRSELNTLADVYALPRLR